MRLEDQIRQLASKLVADQEPVTVDEIMSGVDPDAVFGDGVGQTRRGWIVAAAAAILLSGGVVGVWLAARGDSSRIKSVDTPATSTSGAPQINETDSSDAAVIGETINFDDGGKARINGVIRDAPARNTLYDPLGEGMTSTEIEVEHCIGGEEYRPTINWQPPEYWLIAERWSGILDDGTEVEARAGYYLRIESRPGACSRGYITVPTPSGSNVVAMTLIRPRRVGDARPVHMGSWDLSQSRPIEAPLQPTKPPEAFSLGEAMILPSFSHATVTVLEVIDNATPKPSAVDLRNSSGGEPPEAGRKLVEIRAEICTDPLTEMPPATSYNGPSDLRWLIQTSDNYVGNAGGETYNGWEPVDELTNNPNRWSPGVASSLVVNGMWFSESGTPALGECAEGYVQIDLPDDAVPAAVIIAGGSDEYREIGRMRLGPPTAVESTTTPTPDGALVPRAVDAATVRPLADLDDGDVVVPTYVPDGMVYDGPARSSDDEFFFVLRAPDGVTYVWVRQWPALLIGGPDGVQPAPPDPATLNDPDHPPVVISGITWGWFDFEQARIAHVGRSVIFAGVDGLDEAEAKRYIEGLRAASIEQFPGPIQYDTADGLSVVDGDDFVGAEVVARDEEFELAALQVGDQVCTKLTQTRVPATMGFSADCQLSARLAELGIVDLIPLDDTDTRHLIVGAIDSAAAIAARITSPNGESVVVATGPVNQAIDGRFFLARLDVNISDLGRLAIEDASP